MLSKTCTYALQAMIYLAALKDAQAKEDSSKHTHNQATTEAEQSSDVNVVDAGADTMPHPASSFATLSQSLKSASTVQKRTTYKGDEFISVQIIAENLNVSFHFLKKILQTLAEADILRTSRGAGGGVKFARSPEKISLYDVVAAIDGERTFKGCLLYLRGCGHETPCPLHDRWTGERERLTQYYKGVTLLEAGRNFTEYKLRLAFDAVQEE